MRIEVTAADIAAGMPSDPCGCPVALAARRAFGKWCEVDIESVEVYRSRRDARPAAAYPHPPAVAAFVEAFDAGRPVEPFAFDLDGPEDAARA